MSRSGHSSAWPRFSAWPCSFCSISSRPATYGGFANGPAARRSEPPSGPRKRSQPRPRRPAWPARRAERAPARAASPAGPVPVPMPSGLRDRLPEGRYLAVIGVGVLIVAAGVATVALGVLGGGDGKDGKPLPAGQDRGSRAERHRSRGLARGAPGLAGAVAREVKSDGFKVEKIGGDAGAPWTPWRRTTNRRTRAQRSRSRKSCRSSSTTSSSGRCQATYEAKVGSANVAVIIGQNSSDPASSKWTSCSRPEPTPGWRPSSASRSCFRSTCPSRATFAACAMVRARSRRGRGG